MENTQWWEGAALPLCHLQETSQMEILEQSLEWVRCHTLQPTLVFQPFRCGMPPPQTPTDTWGLLSTAGPTQLKLGWSRVLSITPVRGANYSGWGKFSAAHWHTLSTPLAAAALLLTHQEQTQMAPTSSQGVVLFY